MNPNDARVLAKQWRTLEDAGYCLHDGEWYRDGEKVGTFDEALAHHKAQKRKALSTENFVLLVALIMALAAVAVWVLGAWGSGGGAAMSEATWKAGA